MKTHVSFRIPAGLRPGAFTGALLACAAIAAAVALPAFAAAMTALVHKPSVEVRGEPDFKAPALATLKRDAKLQVAGQKGLWFEVKLADGRTGYVRVNDVRMAYAANEGGDANVRALFTGKAGKGRVTETAGVRGLDESSLASAGYDATQLAALEGHRVGAADADAQAASDGWVAMTVPWPAEATKQKAGGYVLVTRGMYELLADDGEVAAVLGHEIGHVVQRDHYTVIHKQEVAQAGTDLVASQVNVGGGLAGQFAKDYATRYGAKVLLTSLDREAEFRADQASEVYLARSGFDPLSLYAVLQKMTAFGTKSAALAQLYRTHPPLGDRLDRIDTVANPGVAAYSGR